MNKKSLYMSFYCLTVSGESFLRWSWKYQVQRCLVKVRYILHGLDPFVVQLAFITLFQNLATRTFTMKLQKDTFPHHEMQGDYALQSYVDNFDSAINTSFKNSTLWKCHLHWHLEILKCLNQVLCIVTMENKMILSQKNLNH
jgi:hypothetical protein